jgi:hypothetical protein
MVHQRQLHGHHDLFIVSILVKIRLVPIEFTNGTRRHAGLSVEDLEKFLAPLRSPIRLCCQLKIAWFCFIESLSMT